MLTCAGAASVLRNFLVARRCLNKIRVVWTGINGLYKGIYNEMPTMVICVGFVGLAHNKKASGGLQVLVYTETYIVQYHI